MNIYESDYTGNYVYGQDYTGFVYMWTDHKRKMFYIGGHQGSVDDGYAGSGTYFKRAYACRPKDFTRAIIQYVNYPDRTKLDEAEDFWLSQIDDDELGTTFYNLKKSAYGLDSALIVSGNNENGEVKWLVVTI